MRKPPQPKETVAEPVVAVSKVKGGYVRPGSNGTGESIQKLITEPAKLPKPLKVVANPAPVAAKKAVAVDPKTPAKATKQAPAAKQTPASPKPAAAKAPVVPKEPTIVKSKVSALKNEDTFLEIGNQKVVLTGSAADQQKQAAEWTRRHKNGELKGRNLADVGDEIRGKKNYSARLKRLREFALQADEGGIALTGRVPHDRFVKKIREQDLDRRDANLLRAGLAGGAAGALMRGKKLSGGKRALIGAGLGGLGVLGIRQITDSDRDIYGERNRGSKRAELIPAAAGLGTAAWLAGKRFNLLSAKLRNAKYFTEKRDTLSKVRDAALLGSGLGVMGLTGYAGYRAHNLYKLAKSEMPGVARYAKATMRSVNRASKDVAKTADTINENIPPIRKAIVEDGVVRWPFSGKKNTQTSTKKWWQFNHGERKGLKEFGSMGVGRLYRKKAALLKKGLFIEKRDPNFPIGHKNGRLQYTEMRPALADREQYKGVYYRLANKGNVDAGKQQVPLETVASKLMYPNEIMPISPFRYDGKMQHALRHDDVMQKHETKMKGGKASAIPVNPRSQMLSSRLRGLKEFNDYRLYYFKGRNTGIAAKSADEARAKKKRGGDELVAVRTPNETERSQMSRGIWVRTRRDGKSPDQSKYGKGRGQGPARKNLQAKFFSKKEKKELGPTASAAISGGISGAGLGGLSILRRGASAKGAALAALKLGALSSGVVGGGTWVGSKLIGEPRVGEGAPITKRAAIGGALAGAVVGGGAGLFLRNSQFMKKAATSWRPAHWITQAPVWGSGLVGAGVGGGIGALQGADEGQQVDSIRNIKKDMKKLSAKNPQVKELGRSLYKQATRWYAGKNLSGIQRMALKQARAVDTKGARKLRDTFVADNHSTNRLVMGAGVVPPVATTAIGVGATYHSATLGKDKKEKQFRAAFPVTAIKNTWKTDPKLKEDFLRRVSAAVRNSVASNKKQYGVKEFQVSPLNVEPMAATKERRSSERAAFLKKVGLVAGIGAGVLGGSYVGYKVSRARGLKLAADVERKAAAQKVRADRYAGQSHSRTTGGFDFKSWEDDFKKRSQQWSDDLNKRWGQSGAASSSRSYDEDYIRRSKEARAKAQSARSSSAGSSAGARSGARGVGADANPHAGTPIAAAWESWRSAQRMATESEHEGERVAAAMAADKLKKRHNLARKLRGVKMFGRDDQPRHRETRAWAKPISGWMNNEDLVDKDGNKWSPSSPQLINAMHRQAAGVRVKAQRGYGLTKDTTAVLQGKDRERDASGRVKKREWEKAWFRNAMTTAGLTVAGLAGAGVWRYGRMNPGGKIGRMVGNIDSGVKKTKQDVEGILTGTMKAADDMTGKRVGVKAFASQAKRLREFDVVADMAGWEVRDPRGKSVRVFSPGARGRTRREKYWHEKSDNQRKLWIAGAVGAAAVGGVGGIAAYRLAKGKSLVPSFMLKKPPAAAAAGSKFNISAEERARKTEEMLNKVREETAQRDAARRAANAAKKPGTPITPEANDKWKKTQPTPISIDPNFRSVA